MSSLFCVFCFPDIAQRTKVTFGGHLLLLVASMICIKTFWPEIKVFLYVMKEIVVCLFVCMLFLLCQDYIHVYGWLLHQSMEHINQHNRARTKTSKLTIQWHSGDCRFSRDSLIHLIMLYERPVERELFSSYIKQVSSA